MPTHQELVEEIIRKIEARRQTYGQVLVKSIIFKQDQKWKNYVTKMLPLHISDARTIKEKLDYGNFVLLEEIISLDRLIELIKRLPENKTSSITLLDYSVDVEGTLQPKSDYDSGSEFLNIGWSFEKYLYSKGSINIPREPLISSDLPVFPDINIAVKEFMGTDIERYSNYGLMICLPNYRARIEEVNIGLTEVKIRIQPKGMDIRNIIGKLYCELDKQVKHEDVFFQGPVETASVGFRPSRMYVALISKADSELLDSRQYYSDWESLPKGVKIEVPDYSLKELIKNGETVTVEFKEEKAKGENIAKAVVAFANTKGGAIFWGVSDECDVVGLYGEYKDLEAKVAQAIRDNCIPSPEYEVERRQLDGKNILIIHVKEGKSKPYFHKGKIAYIRAGSTNRIAEKYELDEMYKQKQSGYNPYSFR